jgi:DNA-binding MarR family transcriptional regulator
MRQVARSRAAEVGPLTESVGYLLKHASSALRTAMDAALMPLNLTVSQYSCLEQLRQHPGLSNAELARGLFVSRQSTNLVLRGLQERGLLHRPDTVDEGRARPTELTREGTALLREASRAVRAVEQRMVAPLTPAARRQLVEALTACARAVAE